MHALMKFIFIRITILYFYLKLNFCHLVQKLKYRYMHTSNKVICILNIILYCFQILRFSHTIQKQIQADAHVNIVYLNQKRYFVMFSNSPFVIQRKNVNKVCAHIINVHLHLLFYFVLFSNSSFFICSKKANIGLCNFAHASKFFTFTMDAILQCI